MATKTNSKRKAASNAGGGESLDQVRDILFGGQMRAVESRLERLENRIMREVDANRDAASDRMEAIELLVQKETDAIKDKIQTERSKRSADLKSAVADLKATIKDLDKRLGALDNDTSKADAELRDQILTNASNASQQLKQRADELLDELNRNTHELRTEKVDTAALVAMFSDMALRLTDELANPKADLELRPTV